MNTPDVLPDLPDSKSWYKRNLPLIIVGLVGLLVIIVLVALYGDFLGARVAPGLKFRILGPSTLTIGQNATITWDASTAGTKQYPYEKIEYCFGKKDKVKCRVLVSVAPNNGSATLKVPASLPVGRGYLKLTARTADKKLVPSLASVLNGVTVRRLVTGGGSSGGDGGGSSGGGGGGGSGSGGGSSSGPQDPSAEFVEPLDGEQVVSGSDWDVRVELIRTTGANLGCQQWKLNGRILTVNDWNSGQSPDLSAEPCI